MSKINQIKVDNVIYDIEDANVPAWARENQKPSYSYDEISGTPNITNLHTHDNKSILDTITSEDIEKWNNSSSGSSLDIYSTEEQVIGTWVNGKTIYQRTIIGQLGTTDNTNINVGDNMYVMQVIGFIDYPPENCNIPFEYTNPKAPIYYNVTRNVIRLYHSTVFSNQTYYATIIYTKTNE